MNIAARAPQAPPTSSEAATMLTPLELGPLTLPNRFVMSPMTRSRTFDPERIPTPSEVVYYSQRASAGLILTGGIFISPQAIGAVNVPGIYTDQQVEGWKRVTDAVHHAGGRIFAQLAHAGSVSHPSLLNGELPIAPSAVNPAQKVIGATGYIDTVEPRAMTLAEIKQAVEEYGRASENAKRAGFDGVELHGGNVFLVAQFLNSSTNHREDEYGGTPENRARIVVEIVSAMAAAWDRERIGVKLSPNITGIAAYSATECVLRWLSEFKPAYVHLRRGFDSNSKPIEMLREHTFDYVGNLYQGILIGNGAFDPDTAEAEVRRGSIDLVSFARHFIANPDLVNRFREKISLAAGDPATYYVGGEHGFTDYPSAPSKTSR